MAYYVQVVSTERLYGGREEGGWWYDWNTVHFSKRTTKRIAKKMAKRLATEVCEDVSGPVSLCISGLEAQLIQNGYKGRNRFSVLGGDDWEVMTCRTPSHSTRRRPHYE